MPVARVQRFGDGHPLNVAWDGKSKVWINDFDDTTTAPLAADILRSIVSVPMFIPNADVGTVTTQLLASYAAARFRPGY